MTEKIGNSILGYGTSSTGLSAKKRKELEIKVKEELTKKKQKDEEEKLPKLTVPGDFTPEPIPGEANWDEMVGKKKQRGSCRRTL